MDDFVLVCGAFKRGLGTGRPNYELAEYLASRGGGRVHLVSHEVMAPLRGRSNVTWHRVPKPLGRHTLGIPLLDWKGRRVAGRKGGAQARVIVNGGNCLWPGINWVHFLHAAWKPRMPEVSAWRRLHGSCLLGLDLKMEKTALSRASLILANSERTRKNILDLIGGPPDRVHVVYYGTDSSDFHPPAAGERAEARRRLGLPSERPLAAFVGAFGLDRRKGFDVAFDAWGELCRDAAWNADLVVAGDGAELDFWNRRAQEEGLAGRVHFLGFTEEIPALMAAADVLISPARYEPYGLNVHEALCCGLPTFVTRTAGIAERYLPDMDEMLLKDPPDARDLAARLKSWIVRREEFARKAARLGETLRRRTWRDMAEDIARLVVEGPRS